MSLRTRRIHAFASRAMWRLVASLLVAVCGLAIFSPSVRGQETPEPGSQAAGCMLSGVCNNNSNRGSVPGGAVRLAPDPCFVAQNAMRPCPAAPSRPLRAGVEPRLVGTWVAVVNGGRWVWEIDRNGAYRFHSEAGDGAPSHRGIMSAHAGHWSLQATSGLPGWTDGGSYTFHPPATMNATGRLGSGVWLRANVAKN